MSVGLLGHGGLSLDRLQTFCLVAEARGVTKAAKGDATKQSLYSRQIKELEQFFGVELVRRKGRGISLTAAGERLHVIAREQFSALSDFKNACEGLPAELSVGAGESLIQWLLLPRLQTIRSKLPNVRFKFLNLPTNEIVKQLAEGMLDFGIVRKSASQALRAVSLGVVSYSLFVPAGIQLDESKTKLPILLDELPFATLEGEGEFRQELSAAVKRHNVKLRPDVECSSFPLAARALQSAKLAAILPSIASVELKPLGVRELRPELLNRLDREIFLAWNPRLARIRTIIEKSLKTFTEVWRLDC